MVGLGHLDPLESAIPTLRKGIPIRMFSRHQLEAASSTAHLREVAREQARYADPSTQHPILGSGRLTRLRGLAMKIWRSPCPAPEVPNEAYEVPNEAYEVEANLRSV